jgi:oligopeptide/dipeptide ABC transporter ATP-binding protein
MIDEALGSVDRSQRSREMVLEVHDLQVEIYQGRRGLVVLDGIDLHICRGETLGILGESGSGKTMTALAVMGLLPPTAAVVRGHVILNGTDLLQLDQRRLSSIRGRDVGMIFQEPRRSLHPALTVGEQIAETARRHLGISRHEAWARAVELLDLVEIPSPTKRAHDYPFELSGGMCQRVMLAMALVCEPSLLIADEPTTALDVTIQSQILDLIAELQQRLGLAVLFISHDLCVIAEMSDRVAVMYAGQAVESGPTDETFLRPSHPYTEGLLAAIPQAARFSGRLGAIRGQVPTPGKWPSGCRFHPRCAYAREGLCTVGAPALQPLPRSRHSRCVRIGELQLRGIGV